MEYLQSLALRAEGARARMREIDGLLGAPEIVADVRLMLRLVRERAAAAGVTERYAAYAAAPGEDTLSRLIAALRPETGEDGGAVIEVGGGNRHILGMYTAYCKQMKYAVRAKGNTLTITAPGRYAAFAGEGGVHATADGDVTVYVLPLPDAVQPLDMRDVRTDVFHAGGAGGQNINKVETAVRMTHTPTGIVVTCQDERSQLENRNRCRQRLEARVNEYYAAAQTAARAVRKADAPTAVVRLYGDVVTDPRTGVSVPKKQVQNGDIAPFLQAYACLEA
ncbi:MAG: hypothetical protein LBM78_03470 [Clostridiales bacterium]|jgi:protein subunit release factor A|nr:hypothetical protein [Clostridiales bacterium]